MERFLINSIPFFMPFLLCLNSREVFSINEELGNDARSVALGDVRALSNGLTNPAFIPFLLKSRISVCVYNRFQMDELNTGSLCLLLPNSFLDAGIQLIHFGYDDYSVVAFEAGLAKKLSSKISLGAKLLYFNQSTFLNDRPESGLKVGIGLRIHLSQVVRIGLLTENLGATSDRKDYFFHAGIEWEAINSCTILGEVTTDIRNGINVSIGSDYSITDQLRFRAGYHINPSSPSLGTAFSFDHFMVETSFLFHQTLGNSGIIEVSYLF